MARNRMIKPEFWTSEQILNCSPMARLLFIGILNYADDNGIHPASAKTLKAEIFPADDIPIEAIKGFVNELIQQSLLREYAVNDKSFWLITGWKTHQKIERPKYRYPLPQSDLINLTNGDKLPTLQQTFDEDSAISRRSVVDKSTTTHRSIDSENKIREMKIKNICGVETPPVCVSTYSSDACRQIFKYWQSVMNHPRAKLDSKRKRVIEKALKLGFTIDEVKQSIDGCKNTPFNMGQNDRQQIYDDITLILRDAEHIERFITNANKQVIEQSAKVSKDLRAGVL
ncbi:hypothetical protein [Legionella resiliens]|uniref:Uncharacterized protein n=1 Tax=Legionella resiliens TaxID=2905958 RepID=A0ABS8X7A1_9GAMM|nr:MULTISPECIES: hypothetical protein [unclassified Legionella]MCE0723989.1 hypothetical protein [Legionella sp. 9fVS26]MCE3533142.1 hypothetical protein [Legionella sp. 8cVS16]